MLQVDWNQTEMQGIKHGMGKTGLFKTDSLINNIRNSLRKELNLPPDNEHFRWIRKAYDIYTTDSFRNVPIKKTIK